jgi:hypothetical protein
LQTVAAELNGMQVAECGLTVSVFRDPLDVLMDPIQFQRLPVPGKTYLDYSLKHDADFCSQQLGKEKDDRKT